MSHEEHARILARELRAKKQLPIYTRIADLADFIAQWEAATDVLKRDTKSCAAQQHGAAF